MRHRHLACVVATLVLAVGILTPAAAAHVTANPGEAAAGGFARLDFRVPNERDVPTVEVTFAFPPGITSASIKPVAGWTAEVKTEKLDAPIDAGHGEEATEQVTEITWTGGKIMPGEFEEFPVSLRMPAEGELDEMVFFPTVQTYDGGEEVSWIDRPTNAQDDVELEHPAPVVTLLPAADDHHGGDHAKAMDDSDASAGDEQDAGASDDDELTRDHVQDELQPVRGMAIVGIVVGVIAAIIGLVAFRRAGRRD